MATLTLEAVLLVVTKVFLVGGSRRRKGGSMRLSLRAGASSLSAKRRVRLAFRFLGERVRTVKCEA